jgi:hypothetical protein
MQVFSETGGFMTIVFMLTAIFASRLQNTIYYTTLIKSFYKQQKDSQSLEHTRIIEQTSNDLSKS